MSESITLKVESCENGQFEDGTILEVINSRTNQFTDWKIVEAVVVTGSVKHHDSHLTIQLKQGPNYPDDKYSYPSAVKNWCDRIYTTEV